MSDQNALATVDQALLDLWKQSKTGEDTGSDQGAKLPILKLIQPVSSALEQCKHGIGKWVVGFKRDNNGVIEDHGHLVRGVVILTIRNRFSYYDQGNTAMNCATPLFSAFKDAVGSKHKYQCIDKTCPYRMKEGTPKCRAQKVIFGVAITDDGQEVDCVAYIQGNTYMPFADYVDQVLAKKIADGKGGFFVPPVYSRVTLLGSAQKKNGAVVYFEGAFQMYPKAPDTEKFKIYHEKHLETLKYIDSVNSSNTGAYRDAASNGNGSQANRPANVAPVGGHGGAIDIPSGMPTEFQADDDIPFDLGAGSKSGGDAAEPAPEDFDIEAAIQNALKS